MEVPVESERTPNDDFRPQQENQQRNPIEENRRPTDIDFMFLVFLPILVLWLIINVLGFSLAKVDQEETLHFMQAFVNGPVTIFTAMLPISLFICMLVTYLCLFFYEKFTECCIYSSIMISILVGISYIFSGYSWVALLFFSDPSKSRHSFTDHIRSFAGRQLMISILILIYYIVYFLIHLIFVVSSAFCFFKTDLKVLSEITINSCRLIQRSFSLLPFAGLISILVFLVFSFTMNTFLIEIYASTKIFNYLSILTLFGGLSVTGLIINFARMVISEYSINYFYTKDERAPIGIIIIKIGRYHVGTAMFASMMFVSFISAIIQAIKHKTSWKNTGNCIFYDLAKVFLVTNPDIALIFSSIYGTGFMKSYQKAFDVIIRRPITYLAMLLIIDGVFAIILLSLIIPIAGMIAMTIIVVAPSGRAEDWADTTKTMSAVVYGCSYTIFVFALLISSSMKAQLVNKIIILNNEDRDTQEKTEMLNRF